MYGGILVLQKLNNYTLTERNHVQIVNCAATVIALDARVRYVLLSVIPEQEMMDSFKSPLFGPGKEGFSV